MGSLKTEILMKILYKFSGFVKLRDSPGCYGFIEDKSCRFKEKLFARNFNLWYWS